MTLCPQLSSSDTQVVSGGSTLFDPSMAADEYWLFVSNTACWIAQGAAPSAAAADGSMFVPAGVAITINGRNGAKLAVIQDSAGGKASLTRVGRF